MKQIIKLLEDVIAAKTEYPAAKIPAADHIFYYQTRDKNCIPMLKTTKHAVTVRTKVGRQTVETTVKKFFMNKPSESVKLLVGNPRSWIT